MPPSPLPIISPSTLLLHLPSPQKLMMSWESLGCQISIARVLTLLLSCVLSAFLSSAIAVDLSPLPPNPNSANWNIRVVSSMAVDCGPLHGGLWTHLGYSRPRLPLTSFGPLFSHSPISILAHSFRTSLEYVFGSVTKLEKTSAYSLSSQTA